MEQTQMKKILDLFLSSDATLEMEKSGVASRRDLQICAAALLLHAACIDGRIRPEELQTLLKKIIKQFGLADAKAAEIVEVGDVFRRQKKSTADMLVAINNRFERSQ